MTRRAFSFRFVVTLLLSTICLLERTADAQVLYGSIVGTVRDSVGGALPGATVIITHDETKATRETISDGTGAYHFPTVQTGAYTVRANLPGFRAFVRSSVPVTLNNATRVDIALSVGQLQETVTVTADASVLQTERSEVRHELRSRELRDLPVPVGRNYQELFKTLPGFTPPTEPHSIPSNPSRALQFNVNGASSSTNNTRIDGVSSTNIWLPHVVAYVPALESIETVNVVTNNFDAEQGLAGGSAISVQIKSGTNVLHGSMFEYHNNEKLRAHNFFDPPGTSKGRWRFNQYGGTLGGPVVHDRIFYFASYEGTKRRENVSRTMSVPTAAVRRGDFSATGATIYDPATGNPDGTGRRPFAGNVIPGDRISPVARKIVPFLPLPNLPGEFNNYFVQAPFVFDRWTLDTKMNWNATDRLQIFGDARVGDSGTNGCLKRFDGNFLVGTCVSDRRFKRNITPFGRVLDQLTALQPVNYYWRTTEYPERHFGNAQAYGLIAQDVEQILPELVVTHDDGYKAVDYTKLPLLTIEAVKELKNENDELKRRLAEVERLLAEMLAGSGRH